jgi:hypothetical protein
MGNREILIKLFDGVKNAPSNNLKVI